jgi:hypothetical protein
MLTQIYSENMKERSHLGNIVADGNTDCVRTVASTFHMTWL